jgi:hypothetical protein
VEGALRHCEELGARARARARSSGSGDGGGDCCYGDGGPRRLRLCREECGERVGRSGDGAQEQAAERRRRRRACESA